MKYIFTIFSGEIFVYQGYYYFIRDQGVHIYNNRFENRYFDYPMYTIADRHLLVNINFVRDFINMKR